MRSNRDRRLRSIGSSSTTSTWRADDSGELIAPRAYRRWDKGSAPGGGADEDVVGQDHHLVVGPVGRQVDETVGHPDGGVVRQLPFDDETTGIMGVGHVLHVPISTPRQKGTRRFHLSA